MSNYLKVEGHENLVRDTGSNAIINKNVNAYEVAKKRAEEAQRQRDEIRDTNREIKTKGNFSLIEIEMILAGGKINHIKK